MVESENIELKEPNAQEKAFAEFYLTNGFNKAKAARDAKYSKNFDRQIGYEVYNRTHVKAYIEKVINERILSSVENIKLISDIAQSNLTDYYSPVKVVKAKKQKVGLQFLIDQVQDEIDFENEFKRHVTMDDEQLASFNASQNHRKQRKLRLEIELRRNPKATRIIDGPEELVTEMRLDMNALVADKEKGKVKSITFGKDGLKVEMYAADAAQERIARLHGDFEKDNEQSKPVVNIKIE